MYHRQSIGILKWLNSPQGHYNYYCFTYKCPIMFCLIVQTGADISEGLRGWAVKLRHGFTIKWQEGVVSGEM